MVVGKNALKVSQRITKKNSFVKNSGLKITRSDPLKSDASFRTYERLYSERKTFILMDAPPQTGENCKSFLAISNYLIDLGFSAPNIYKHDLENGFLILEDFGDRLFSLILKDNSNEKNLYINAIDCLLALQDKTVLEYIKIFDNEKYKIPLYDELTLLKEVNLLIEWFYPTIFGEQINEKLRAEYVSIWKDLINRVDKTDKVLVLRDYHVDNLIYLKDKNGINKVGLLDFQDAVIGSPLYDLVSLLEDSRILVKKNIIDEMIKRFLNNTNIVKSNFIRDYSIFAAQRHSKVIGIFTRLYKRDKKSNYLKFIPYTWDLLEKSLANLPSSDLSFWLNKNIPPEFRKKKIL